MLKRIFNLSAKIISILYIILITLFALDTKIFSIDFLIHLLPTLILTACLILALRNPKIGGIAFFISGIGTIIVFNTYRELLPFLLVSLIPMIVGILFWKSKR